MCPSDSIWRFSSRCLFAGARPLPGPSQGLPEYVLICKWGVLPPALSPLPPRPPPARQPHGPVVLSSGRCSRCTDCESPSCFRSWLHNDLHLETCLAPGLTEVLLVFSVSGRFPAHLLVSLGVLGRFESSNIPRLPSAASDSRRRAVPSAHCGVTSAIAL